MTSDNGRPGCCASRCRARWCRSCEPLIASFCQAYPEIEVEIAASEELVDLAAGGFDAGIRLGQFIARRHGRGAADAAVPVRGRWQPRLSRATRPPGAAGRSAPPRLPAMRRSNGAIAPWSFIDGNKTIEAIVSGPLIAHDYPTLLGAAMQGVGLAQVPGPLAKAPIAEGRLQALLTPFAVMTPGVFLYHPGKRQVLPKLRAFIEHVKHQSADAPRGETNGRRLRKADVPTPIDHVRYAAPLLGEKFRIRDPKFKSARRRRSAAFRGQSRSRAMRHATG